MIRKTLTVQIRGNIYYLLISCILFPEEEKGRCKETCGIGELLYINQHILKDRKTRRKNLAMAKIDYKKACGLFLQSWIIDCIKNIQEIRRSLKAYREYHEKLKSGTGNMREKLSWDENPEKESSREMRNHHYYL